MKEKKNDDLVSLTHDFQMMHNGLVTSCLSIIYGYLETARDVIYGRQLYQHNCNKRL